MGLKRAKAARACPCIDGSKRSPAPGWMGFMKLRSSWKMQNQEALSMSCELSCSIRRSNPARTNPPSGRIRLLPKRKNAKGDESATVTADHRWFYLDRAFHQRRANGHDSGERLYVPERWRFQSKVGRIPDRSPPKRAHRNGPHECGSALR